MAEYEIIARSVAMKEGLRHYFTGKPCKHGHTTLRHTVDGSCIECGRAASRAFYHRDQKSEERKRLRKEAKKRWKERVLANPERKALFNESRKLQQRTFYNDPLNAALRRAKARERYGSDTIRDIEKVHRRRVRKEAAGGTFTALDIQNIYRMQRGKCAYCRVELWGVFQIDHIDPKGGNHPRNLQLTCRKPSGMRPRCNQVKSDRDPIEFVQKEFGLLL